MEDCSICLESFRNKELYISTCKHKFHKTCINQWFETDNRCPLCRTKLRLPTVTVQFCDHHTLSIINWDILTSKLKKFENKNKLTEKKVFIENKNNKFYIYNSKKLLGYFNN
jgi:hypothetical protein